MKIELKQNNFSYNLQNKKVNFCGNILSQPQKDVFEPEVKKKITMNDVEMKVKRGYYFANQTAALLTPYMQTLGESVVPSTPLGTILSTFYGALIFALTLNNRHFNKLIESTDESVTNTKAACKRELSKEDYEIALKRGLFKPDYKRSGFNQLDKNDIKALTKLTDKEFEKAKTLLWIDKRHDYNQFSGEAIADLVKLSDEQYKRAESLFYLDKRNEDNQFSGEVIVELAKLPDNVYKKAENLFYKKFKNYKGCQDFLLHGAHIIPLCRMDKQIEEAKKYNPIIKTEIENIVNSEYVDVNGITTLAKAVNELKGKECSKINDYIYEPSKLDLFYTQINTIGDDKYTIERLKDDIEIEKKFGSAKVFSKYNPNSPVSKYFYNLYLKDIENKIDKGVIEKCKNFYDKYNTQIYVSTSGCDIYEMPKIIDKIDKEFQKWQKAGQGKEKLPPFIDFNKADKNYFLKGGVFGDCRTGTASYMEGESRALHFSKQNLELIKQNIRHEMTHVNDLKSNYITAYSKKELKEIMPKNNPFGGKYYKEFRNAGIEYSAIEYAYHNPEEYIAVASEGDMTKYSNEFKKVLVNLGMPEWELNLEK